MDLPPGIDIEPDALPRCWPAVDACETEGERTGSRWICVEWANGSCERGAACAKRHRAPTEADEQRLLFSADGVTHDIFGRPRIAATNSVADPGSSSTLHVKGLPPSRTAQERRAALELLSEWGELAKTWTLADPSEGYVKFKKRSCAQMCAEAMHGRPLRPDYGGALEISVVALDPGKVQASQARAPPPRAAPARPPTPHC